MTSNHTEPLSSLREAGHLQELLKLRLLVGFLGERSRFAWWPTAFYEPSSRAFLEPVFAKTLRLAQYYGVVEAARRIHDEHLNVGSFHLFRLPEEKEQDLHNLLLRSAPPLGWDSTDTAIESLRNLAGTTVVTAVGPTAIGQIKELHSTAITTSLAAAYNFAFAQGVKAYPYMPRHFCAFGNPGWMHTHCTKQCSQPVFFPRSLPIASET